MSVAEVVVANTCEEVTRDGKIQFAWLIFLDAGHLTESIQKVVFWLPEGVVVVERPNFRYFLIDEKPHAFASPELVGLGTFKAKVDMHWKDAAVHRFGKMTTVSHDLNFDAPMTFSCIKFAGLTTEGAHEDDQDVATARPSSQLRTTSPAAPAEPVSLMGFSLQELHSAKLRKEAAREKLDGEIAELAARIAEREAKVLELAPTIAIVEELKRRVNLSLSYGALGDVQRQKDLLERAMRINEQDMKDQQTTAAGESMATINGQLYIKKIAEKLHEEMKRTIADSHAAAAEESMAAINTQIELLAKKLREARTRPGCSSSHIPASHGGPRRHSSPSPPPVRSRRPPLPSPPAVATAGAPPESLEAVVYDEGQSQPANKPSSQTKHLTIRLLSGEAISSVTISGNTSVMELKHHIFASHRLVPERQRLIFGGHTLDDAVVINGSDVEDGDVITLLLLNDDRFLTGGADKTAKLWSAATGKCIRTFKGHERAVWGVAFSPDGTMVLTGSEDCTARLWNAVTGECIRTLEHHAPVVSAAFSPDGILVLTGSEAGSARLWRAVAGECILTFEAHERRGWTYGVLPVAFSPDGTLVLTGSIDDTAKLWSAVTGECISTFEGHESFVSCVAFSPDGTLVLTGSEDGSAKLWHAMTGECMRTFKGHKCGSITVRGMNCTVGLDSVAFSPDGAQVLTGSQLSIVQTWNAATGECYRTIKGPGYPFLTEFLAFSPDGTVVVTGYEADDYNFGDDDDNDDDNGDNEDDTDTRLWSAVTGEEFIRICTGLNHMGRVAFPMSFSLQQSL